MPIGKTKIVKWTYTHWLNSKSSTNITKTGEYFGKVKHTTRHWDKCGAQQMAYVQFKGNKRVSFVPLDELKFI